MNKKEQKRIELISNGWIPLQVSQTGKNYLVNSQTTMGSRYLVKQCPTLHLSCSHEHGEYNAFTPCSHIKAVQEYLLSSPGFNAFDQEMHVTARHNGLAVAKTKQQWEWLISNSRGDSIGCCGAKVEGLSLRWWCTYNGNPSATWDTCQEALNYLLGMTAF